MTAVNKITRQFVNRAGLASLSAYAVTSIHHVYGGLFDGCVLCRLRLVVGASIQQVFAELFGKAPAPNRLLVPMIMAVPLLIMLVSLYLYSRTSSRAALYSFSIVAMLSFVILLGLLHGGYGHIYKDILFLVNGPAELYYRLNPNEHYPPNDIFFEITGVLDMVTGYFVALSTVRLLRDRQKSERPSSVQEQALSPR